MKSFKQFLTQPWKNTSDSYESALAKVEEQKNAFTELLHIVTPPDGKYLVNIKTKESYHDKLARKPANKIHDLLRGAVLTNTKQEMVDVVRHIKLLATIVECEHKREPSPDTGYHGSVHVKVKLGDIIAEIQIMPKVLWDFKELFHGNYEAARSGGLDPSKALFSKHVFDTINKGL